MQSTPVPPQVVEAACSPHRHRAPLVGAATDPCCHSSGLGWNPSFYRQQAPGPCSSGINSPCPTGLEWPSVFSGFTHQAKTWEAETLQGQAPQLHQQGRGVLQSGTPEEGVIAGALLISTTGNWLSGQMPVLPLQSGAQQRHRHAQEEAGPNLFHWRGSTRHSPRKRRRSKTAFTPGTSLWKKGLLTITVVRPLTITVVRLSASIACNVYGKVLCQCLRKSLN